MSTGNGSSKIAVAVIGAGEMGSATSKRLHDRGARVKTSLRGRSAATKARIDKLGVPHVDDDAAFLEGADIILSIVPPGVAVAVAEQYAPTIKKLGKRVIYIDCNAVSPQTTDRIAAIVQAAGADFVDGGIVGTPPKDGYEGPIFFLSGPEAERALTLRDVGLEARAAGDKIGDASALKLSYAGMTKGFTAIATTMFTAAMRYGVADKLATTLAEMSPGLWETMTATVPRMPPKAYRWVAEMQEIAQYTTPDGLGNEIYDAVSALYVKIAAQLEAEGMAEGTKLGKLAEELSKKPTGSKS